MIWRSQAACIEMALSMQIRRLATIGPIDQLRMQLDSTPFKNGDLPLLTIDTDQIAGFDE